MYENPSQSMPVLWVTGHGSVKVEPDTAEVKLGVVTENESLTLAQQENSEVTKRVIETIQAVGVEASDIQTAEYYIFPEYDYQDGVQLFRGYRVTHLLNVTIRNIGRVGEVMDAAVSQGANRVSNVTFDIQNRSEYEQEALRRSLFDAQKKARTLSNTLNVRLYPLPIKIFEGRTSERESASAFSNSMVKGAVSTPIESGQTEVTAEIQAQFTYY
ncbi:SIMPL domain-containing protein [Halobacillus litoralis]|uniref:SIMPL domain-containing protein n=1 Tax=Halobacillus litoralis TaxID=45668 RepID=UPI001CD587EE|nr:SIMPL domain-containing protein [Halobacillus litoralis]MCA0969522.1 SIMPL domain-containing protein [Halobacillus litoralis]